MLGHTAPAVGARGTEQERGSALCGAHCFLLYIRHQPLASTFFPGKNEHAPPAASPGLPWYHEQ